jgi:hypothetical protein
MTNNLMMLTPACRICGDAFCHLLRLLQFAQSAAGWLVQALLLAYGNITAALPACFVIFLAALAAWLHATLRLSQQMQHFAPSAGAGTAEPGRVVKLPAAAGTGAVRGPSQMQLQMQSEDVGWWLPMPRELAIAAAGAERWSAAGRSAASSPAAGASALPATTCCTADSLFESAGTDGGTITGGSYSIASAGGWGGVDVGGVALPTQPHLLHNAGYWDRLFVALADDQLLLESVISSHGHAEQAQQQQQGLQPGLPVQREQASQMLHDVRGTASAESAGITDAA